MRMKGFRVGLDTLRREEYVSTFVSSGRVETLLVEDKHIASLVG
jgi:hypothetical protein